MSIRKFRKVKTKGLTIPVEASTIIAFNEKLKEDNIVASHFLASMISAYLNGDIYVIGVPPAVRRNRIYTYKATETPNDVIGVKFATTNSNVIINMSPIQFPDPEYTEVEQDFSHLEPYQEAWVERNRPRWDAIRASKAKREAEKEAKKQAEADKSEK